MARYTVASELTPTPLGRVWVVVDEYQDGDSPSPIFKTSSEAQARADEMNGEYEQEEWAMAREAEMERRFEEDRAEKVLRGGK